MWTGICSWILAASSPAFALALANVHGSGLLEPPLDIERPTQPCTGRARKRPRQAARGHEPAPDLIRELRPCRCRRAYHQRGIALQPPGMTSIAPRGWTGILETLHRLAAALASASGHGRETSGANRAAVISCTGRQKGCR
jgi:hypothetical protein